MLALDSRNFDRVAKEFLNRERKKVWRMKNLRELILQPSHTDNLKKLRLERDDTKIIAFKQRFAWPSQVEAVKNK